MDDYYLIWLHRVSHAVYAVRFVRRGGRHRYRLDGICGPLEPLETWTDAALAAYPYQTGPIAREFEARQHEFNVHVPRLVRRWLTAGSEPRPGRPLLSPRG